MNTAFGSMTFGADLGTEPVPIMANFDLSVLTPSGLLEDFAGVPYRRLTALQTRLDGVATGTAFTMDCFATTVNCVEASIDGGAWTDITPATLSTRTTLTVFTGLADAAHAVAIRTKSTGAFYVYHDTTNLAVTGAAPALTGDPAAAGKTSYLLNSTGTSLPYGVTPIAANLRLEAAATAATNGSSAYPVVVSGATYAWGSFGGSQPGMVLRYRAKVATVEVFVRLDGSKWRLVVGGVAGATVAAPNTGEWGWLTIATGLSTAAEVEHQLTCAAFNAANTSVGAGAVFALRTSGGTGVNTSSAPSVLPLLACYGDSITGDQSTELNDATAGWIWPLGKSLGMAYANLGVGSSTVKNFGTGSEASTTASGEARTAQLTGIVPEPAKAVVPYGTNDLGQLGGVETAAAFQVSYGNMLASFLAGTTATKFFCVGILPKASSDPATIATWNAAIQAAVAAQASSRCVYVDPAIFGLVIATDFQDGTHPNSLGDAKIASGLATAMAGGGTPTLTSHLSCLLGVGG